MYVGRDFDNITSQSKPILTIDFSRNLGLTPDNANETISTATVTCTLDDGTDPSPGSHVSGGAVIDSSKAKISQKMDFTNGGVAVGNRYLIRYVFTTSSGAQWDEWSFVTAEQPS